jgi:hypothetical protein
VIVSLKILCVPRSGDCHARSIRSSHEPGPPFLPSPKGAGSLAVF